MKNLILTLILVFNSISLVYSQNEVSSFRINRAYGNLNFGYNRSIQAGTYIHFLDYFTLGFNFISSKDLVAKKADLIYGNKLFDEFESLNLLLGVSTSFKRKFDAGISFGLSELKGKINNDIYQYQNPLSQSLIINKSTIEYFTEIGFATRINLDFEIREYFGLILSGQNVYTKKHNELTISFGICFGLVQDYVHITY